MPLLRRRKLHSVHLVVARVARRSPVEFVDDVILISGNALLAAMQIAEIDRLIDSIGTNREKNMNTDCPMQFEQLNLIHILQHAARWHGDVEVVTSSVEGGIHRTTYSALYKRTARLSNALRRLGVDRQDRVATMAWNTWRHLECWYAISGIEAVCHTLNPRLFPDQIDFIVNHAQDRVLFVDTTFLPVIENVIDRLPTLECIVVMTDSEHMPESTSFDVPVHCYEELLSGESESFDWPEIAEGSISSLCYTSGTTGDPKGVAYTHRSNLIHALSTSSADVFNMTGADTFLMIVPMFHANSWGLSFSLPMIGAKLVMTGPNMDGASVHALITKEGCTKSAAVPTVWTGLLGYLDSEGLSIPTLTETIIGGSAVPQSMIERFEKDYDVDVIHAWGMTEMSPLGTLNRPLPFMTSLSDEERMMFRVKQGRAPFGVDMKIVDDDGTELPRDGTAFGRLLVRGHWVVERYYLSEESALDENGWFDTGDIATIDEHGFMQITDRAKDLIKSGGEWISSVDIENCAMAHPELEIAACIGIPDEKWEERPLLIAVRRAGCEPTKDSVLGLVAQSFAKWQVPDDVVFIEEMPLTATGKIDKKPLRERFAN